jgi:hypothetical protein
VEGGAPEGDPKLLPAPPDPARAAPPPLSAGVTVDGALTLSAPMTLAGIRAGKAADGAALMVTARRSDGSVEPLLWLYGYRAKFARPYWYEKPLRLAKGTVIEVTPPAAGTVVLLPGRTP